MKNPRNSAPFPESDDFLRIIARFSQGLNKEDTLETFTSFLQQQIFTELGPGSAEIYFRKKVDEDFLPLSPPVGPAANLAIALPDSLPANLLKTAAGQSHPVPRIFPAGNDDTPSVLGRTGNLRHILCPLAPCPTVPTTAILYVGSQEDLPFPEAYLKGLHTLALLIGAHLENIEEIARIRTSMASLEYSERLRQALYEISEQAHSLASEEDLYASLHRIVSRFIDARNFFIALRQIRNGEQFIKFTYYFDEQDPHFQGMEIRIDPDKRPNLTSYILQHGQPLLLGPNTETIDQFCRRNTIDYLGTACHSWIGVPFYLDQLDGVVVVQSYSEVVYTEQDKDLLVYVARQIGDALGRKKTIDDLRDANELFSLFMTYSPVYVYIKEVTSSESRVLQASENFKTMIGQTGSEIVGKTMSELFPPEFAEKITADDWAVANNGKGVQLEEHLHGRTYTTIKFPIRRKDKILLAGYTIDITERKQMEEALRESERRYRIIFERSPLAVITFDSEGTIIDFNDRFVQIMGSTREKLLGFNSARQSSPKMRETIKKALAGEISSFEDSYTSITGGKTSFLRGKFSPVIPGQNPTDVIATLEDITELKQHEKEHYKLEKLESLGLLAGGIAHDFNNVLTGVMANISFAKALLEPTHKSCKPLTEAEKAAKRAAELAQQLLTFARGGEPNKRIISAQRLIHEAVSLMLRGSNVRAFVNVPDSLHSLVADEGQISQVLNNLILNALQAMPEGGTLSITAENAFVPQGNSLGLATGRYIKLRLEDEGCGISPDNLEKIFDPYFSTKINGTGLGLASAYSIILRHKGHIKVNSTIGKGSVFTIYLPSIDVAESEPLATARTGASPRKGGSILVMDDEEMIRDIAAAMLSHLGYKVTTCSSGEEAVELYRISLEYGEPYRAVIMDLTIPGGIGGRQAAESILAIFPEAKLIVSSGYSNDPIMANYRQFGFSGAIAKPYTIQEFVQLLDILPDY